MEQRRVPWAGGGSVWLSLGALVVVLAASIGAAVAVRPPVIQGVRGVDDLRVATYNIHGGFDEFYNTDLEAVARTIQESGANFVLMHFPEGSAKTASGADEFLKSQGVIVRKVGAYGFPNSLRMTIGSESDNKRAVDALARYFKGAA